MNDASRADKTKGVLLVNLGSPDSTSVADVRRYLGQFLMDGHVIDAPYPIRRLIVSGFVLPFRPRRSAHAYRRIWWDDGSPLIVISRKVRDLVAERIDVPVELAMRYGNPSIESGLRALMASSQPLETIRVVPLYPHYAMSTVQSTEVEVRRVAKRMGLEVDLEIAPLFFDEPAYIEALAASVGDHLVHDYDHLLISYHGLPERHLRKTDPTNGHCMTTDNCCQSDSRAHATCYRHQVLRTTELMIEKLEIPREKYTVSFQSRLGRDAWLRPFTVDEAVRLAEAGVKRLLTVCPAFVSDCLETLEEIAIGVKEQFIAAGGEEFEVIPCLNDHPLWIDALCRYCDDGSNAAPHSGTGS